MEVIQIFCALVIVGTLTLLVRKRDLRTVGSEYLTIAAAGWLAEDTCIRLYEHYSYSPEWVLHIDKVPLLVALIWPLVIMSAREVAQGLVGRVPWAPLMVGAIVFVDASMVEVIATNADMWQWCESGHLSVPLIGVLGWCYFASLVSAILDRTAGVERIAVVVLAPLLTHCLLVMTWWTVFRWTLRGDLTPGSWIAMAAVSAAATIFAIRARLAGRGLPLDVAIPRITAACVFFWVLATKLADFPLAWYHTALVAVPYLVATQLRFSEASQKHS